MRRWSCERPTGITTTWTVVGETPSLLTVQLEPEGDRTRLRLRHEHVTRLEAPYIPTGRGSFN